MSDASVIIITYNRPDLLKTLLHKLRKQKGVDLEVIVGDDGSSPPAIIPELMDRYIWKTDQGFCKTELLNQCIESSTSEKIIFLDDDCTPFFEEWAASHIKILEKNNVSRGPITFYKMENGKIISQYNLILGVEGSYFCGVNFGIVKEKLIKIGMFDMDYNGNYGHEDTDIGERIKKNMLSIGFTGKGGSVGHFGKFMGIDESGNRVKGLADKNMQIYNSKWRSKESEV